MATVPTLRVAEKDAVPELPDLPEEVCLALSEAAISAREGLLAMSSVATGLKVMAAMMDAEITGLAGPKGRRDADRWGAKSRPTTVTCPVTS